jgi:hypothetical protein
VVEQPIRKRFLTRIIIGFFIAFNDLPACAYLRLLRLSLVAMQVQCKYRSILSFGFFD